MKYFFSRKGGVRLKADHLERADSLLWHEIFIKNTRIFARPCSFFKFSKSFFEIKISTPFSLVEAKTYLIFAYVNIYILL